MVKKWKKNDSYFDPLQVYAVEVFIITKHLPINIFDFMTQVKEKWKKQMSLNFCPTESPTQFYEFKVRTAEDIW